MDDEVVEGDGDRAPRVERVRATPGLGAGSGVADYWFINGEQAGPVFIPTAGERLETGSAWNLPIEGTLEDLDEQTRKGRAAIESDVDGARKHWGPDEYSADLLKDHVAGAVIYPTTAVQFCGVDDSNLMSAIMRAYNDYVADFASDHPTLKCVAMLNSDDPAAAVAEMTRCREMGLTSVMLPMTPLPGQSYGQAEFDQVWAAAQDMDMPVSLHTGTSRTRPWRLADQAQFGAGVGAENSHRVQTALTQMIYAKVFERFPRIRFGSVEADIGWIPFFLHMLDYNYTQRVPRNQAMRDLRFANGAVPSDFWYQNCWCTFQDDPTVEGSQWHKIGIDNLAWGSDYPHVESTWPRSLDMIKKVLSGLPEQEQAAICYDNTKRIFKFA